MNIDTVIVSANDDPFYLDFWPLVSRIWKTRFNIEPVLVLVSDVSRQVDTRHGRVVHLMPVAGVALALQAQWARFYYATTLGSLVGIISDVDMLPISRHYFCQQLSHVKDGEYAHLNDCRSSYGWFPACYHVAQGDTFRNVLMPSLSTNWEQSVDLIANWCPDRRMQSRLDALRQDSNWFRDELFTTSRILSHSSDRVFRFLKRAPGHRIDRARWKYSEKDLLAGYYYDSHCLRPYSRYQRELDALALLVEKAS